MNGLAESQGPEPAMDLGEYLHLLWARAWLVVLAGVVAGAAAYEVSIRMTPIYEASTRLLVSAPSGISGVDPTSLVTAQTMTTTYSAMLLDQPVLQGVIDALKLESTPEELEKVITVEAVTNTQLLAITVQDPSPQRAADIANEMASVFASRIRELQSERYSASREGLAKQVADMEQQITTTTNQITAIQQEIDALATQTAVVATQTAAVAATQTAANAATQAAAVVARTPVAATRTSRAPVPSTPVATSVVAVPDLSALSQLQARLTQYRTIYATLVTSFEQVRLAEDQTSTNVVVSEPATAPTRPVRPRTTLNTMLAVLAGMLAAAGTIFVVESVDDTIKNPDEIRRKFNLPILGMIAWHESPQDRPIALAEPRSPTTEAFRSLRTNITYAEVDRPLKRLMVTSPTPQDGKTTVASNIAVVLSQNEKLVLLMDADMRRPEIHHKFGLNNRIGLSDLFVRPLESIVSFIQPTQLKMLAVMTSGGLPPNPSELLTSRTMSQVLDKLDQAFDLIVIDTPPVLTVTDAAALAPAVDGVVLVAKPGTTKLGVFREALEQLQAVNARVLGVVLNDVNPRSRTYGHYYNRYYSKYSRYYETGGRKGGRHQVMKSQPDAHRRPNRKG